MGRRIQRLNHDSAVRISNDARLQRQVGGDDRQRHLGFAVAASLIGIVTSYVTFDAMGFRQVAGLTFLFLGLAGAMWHLARDGREQRLAAGLPPLPKGRPRLAKPLQGRDSEATHPVRG